MIEKSPKIYNLEERTYQFTKEVVGFCKKLPRTSSNLEYSKQVLRSAGSVGANYIEANESLGQKDFKMRIKICRKEVKESAYWLRILIETNESGLKEYGLRIFEEAIELKKIFSSIANK